MPKSKGNFSRTFDPDGYRRRAVALCFREKPLRNEVLLVSSTIQPDKWILPGGGIEPREEPYAAALREAQEEAGVSGKQIRHLGIVDDPLRLERTWVFSLRVLRMSNTFPEAEKLGRRRKWFSVEEAQQCLSLYKPTQVKYLDLKPS